MKSYVTMEKRVCVVCVKEYDTNSILMDTRLQRDPKTGGMKTRDTFDTYTVTGFGICPEHEDLKARGFVALVACDPDKSNVRDSKSKPGDVYRTGRLAHIKIKAFVGLFGQQPPENLVCFCDDALIDKLEAMTPGGAK